MAWSWNFSEAMGEGQDAEAHRQEALGLAEQLPAKDRASIYLITRFGAGLLDDQQVTAQYRYSVDIFMKNGTLRDQAYACLVYGGFLEFQDFKTSMQLYEEGLEISRQAGDPWIISVALLSLSQNSLFQPGLVRTGA